MDEAVDVRETEDTPASNEQNPPNIHAPKIQALNFAFVIVAILLAMAAVFIVAQLFDSTTRLESTNDRYNECASAATELMIASDYLTMQCHMFVMTGDKSYLDAYCEELYKTRRRDAAVELLGIKAEDAGATAQLNEALAESNKLATVELYAMRLTSEGAEIEPTPECLASVELKAEDKALSSYEKRKLAESMVLGDEYQEMKSVISQNVDACAEELVKGLEQKVFDLERSTDRLLYLLIAITILFLGIVAFAAISNYVLVSRPMRVHAKNLENQEPLDMIGCYEVQRVSDSYNRLFEAMRRRTSYFKHEAETDALTGLLNRGSYDRLLEENNENVALVLIDVDLFKQVNDEYGHEVGDEVLKKVANLIVRHFRSSDYVCRIGGDEFAVIATNVSPASRSGIEGKLSAIAEDLAESSDGLPRVTLSFGVAFSSDLQGEGNLYHNADKALYASKHSGRDTVTFLEQENDRS